MYPRNFKHSFGLSSVFRANYLVIITGNVTSSLTLNFCSSVTLKKCRSLVPGPSATTTTTTTSAFLGPRSHEGPPPSQGRIGVDVLHIDGGGGGGSAILDIWSHNGGWGHIEQCVCLCVCVCVCVRVCVFGLRLREPGPRGSPPFTPSGFMGGHGCYGSDHSSIFGPGLVAAAGLRNHNSTVAGLAR